ncbi:hypothetical protein [Cesiribacter andamanensis]|uniref:DUF4367 domain-containing protein n=1 Tax=Cesiribacter andamanensis AMV16 TaxID=1279009 RepID=M7NHY5_9BACT|nr:hypothetical protein [Cesiribacter andamanensis]EMR01430.1 hypothetical protein ADICEAN_03441 [Cesiribacter andamanensis AMV16]
MKRIKKNRNRRMQMIGIPIILVAVLVYVFTLSYKPEYEELPYGEIIHTSKRYKASTIADWHKIDLSSFSIEVPKEYRFYLQEGIHGGKTGGLTNLKDTIGFVHGNYYFDVCEGEEDRPCDTLRILNLGSTRLIVSISDEYISAYAEEDDYKTVFKAWARRNIDEKILLEVFKTVEIK